MLKLIKDNISLKPQLFFLNSGNLDTELNYVDTCDDYVSILGYHLTWIASLGIWEEDCNKLDILIDNAETRLGQIPFLLDNFIKHGCAIIYDKIIMESITPKQKNLTYGLHKVFYNNFLSFIRQYVLAGEISEGCYQSVRKGLLFDFFIDWIVNKEFHSDIYLFSDEDLKSLVENEYKAETYFNEYRRKLFRTRMRARIKKILGR